MNSRKIVFVGGAHGVGKSTICKNLCLDLQLKYISASELIKWSQISPDPRNKLVEDISDTQQRLISALSKLLPGNYLLDGHVCLFNSQYEVIKIPMNTFELINPVLISVITSNVEEIRLFQIERGGQVHDSHLISEMQNCEIEHANKIAEHLVIPFTQVSRTSIDSLVSKIKNTLHL